MTADGAPSDAQREVPVLVLGLGNVLLGDDGAGPVALARIERDYQVPDEVRLVEGGTLGLSLLGELTQARDVILVDAVATGEPPGTLVRLDGEAMHDAVRDRLSVHQVGVADLLDAARLIGRYPASLVLLGVVPETIGLGVGRSPAVEEAIAGLSAAVVQEVKGLGYELVPQPGAAARDRPIHGLVRHFGL